MVAFFDKEQLTPRQPSAADFVRPHDVCVTGGADLPGLPPLSDAMTAADLRACERVIAALIGGGAETHISVSCGQHGPAYATVQPHPWPNETGRWSGFFPTWPEAIRAACAYAATHAPVQRNANIRRMALAVISLTDERGTCTEAALIRQGFTAGQVADLHEAACERAGLMCHGVPFVVVRAGLEGVA